MGLLVGNVHEHDIEAMKATCGRVLVVLPLLLCNESRCPFPPPVASRGHTYHVYATMVITMPSIPEDVSGLGEPRPATSL